MKTKTKTVLRALTCIIGSLGLSTSSFCGAQSAAAQDALPPQVLVYIGTYAAKNEEGIHIYRLNMRSGALSRVGGAKGVKNPSFQAIHPNNQFLYSVSEAQDFEGRPSGSLSAFAIDAQSGALTFLNEQTSMGTGPCHVITDRAGKHILAANYGSGSVVVLPIRSDGRLGMPCAFVQHNGSSVHPRQEAPHAHCVNNDASDRFIMSADLGLDKVLIYRYDGDSGQISSNPHLPAAQVKPGSGPRHFAFHPRGKYAYVINELNSTVTAFTYDATRGVLEPIQDISTLPEDFTGDNTTAEIFVSPDGKFVYGSNRGHNSIVVFSVTPDTGKLTLVSHHATRGEQPRNFGIDPTGTFLLAANQRTGNVVVFRLDKESGELEATGHEVRLKTPVCVTFLPTGE